MGCTIPHQKIVIVGECGKMDKNQELFEMCKRFISEQNIHCAETIYQSDRVIEDAYEFIEHICNIVGYAELEDEE